MRKHLLSQLHGTVDMPLYLENSCFKVHSNMRENDSNKHQHSGTIKNKQVYCTDITSSISDKAFSPHPQDKHYTTSQPHHYI